MPNERGKPVLVMDRYSGPDTTYKTVAVWKIGQVWELNHGRLHRIYLFSSSYANTRFRITALGKLWFKDLELGQALTVTFPDNELPRGEEIKIEAKSTGPAIAVVAAIAGAEY